MRAKKHYGQNFISNSNLIQKIIDLLEPEKNSQALVLEIGPGRGALTSILSQKFKKVVAIEIDSELVTDLKINFQKFPNLTILQADVLKLDFLDLVKKYQTPGQPVLLISNLPYYITSPILFKIFADAHLFQKAILMMQKEVAERLCAEVGNSSYNNLSIIASFYASKKYEFLVKRTYFYPQPQVDSAVISLKFQQTNLQKVDDPLAFSAFVRQIFQQRRKTIYNNLGTFLHDKSLAEFFLKIEKIDLQKRPENLDLTAFLNLYQRISQFQKEVK